MSPVPGWDVPNDYYAPDEPNDLPRHEQIASMSVAELSPEERLIWLLGDMMNATENYFGAENPKREGHIYHCAIRILDEVVAPMQQRNGN